MSLSRAVDMISVRTSEWIHEPVVPIPSVPIYSSSTSYPIDFHIVANKLSNDKPLPPQIHPTKSDGAEKESWEYIDDMYRTAVKGIVQGKKSSLKVTPSEAASEAIRQFQTSPMDVDCSGVQQAHEVQTIAQEKSSVDNGCNSTYNSLIAGNCNKKNDSKMTLRSECVSPRADDLAYLHHNGRSPNWKCSDSEYIRSHVTGKEVPDTFQRITLLEGTKHLRNDSQRTAKIEALYEVPLNKRKIKGANENDNNGVLQNDVHDLSLVWEHITECYREISNRESVLKEIMLMLRLSREEVLKGKEKLEHDLLDWEMRKEATKKLESERIGKLVSFMTNIFKWITQHQATCSQARRNSTSCGSFLFPQELPTHSQGSGVSSNLQIVLKQLAMAIEYLQEHIKQEKSHENDRKTNANGFLLGSASKRHIRSKRPLHYRLHFGERNKRSLCRGQRLYSFTSSPPHRRIPRKRRQLDLRLGENSAIDNQCHFVLSTLRDSLSSQTILSSESKSDALQWDLVFSTSSEFICEAGALKVEHGDSSEGATAQEPCTNVQDGSRKVKLQQSAESVIYECSEHRPPTESHKHYGTEEQGVSSNPSTHSFSTSPITVIVDDHRDIPKEWSTGCGKPISVVKRGDGGDLKRYGTVASREGSTNFLLGHSHASNFSDLECSDIPGCNEPDDSDSSIGTADCAVDDHQPKSSKIFPFPMAFSFLNEIGTASQEGDEGNSEEACSALYNSLPHNDSSNGASGQESECKSSKKAFTSTLNNSYAGIRHWRGIGAEIFDDSNPNREIIESKNPKCNKQQPGDPQKYLVMASTLPGVLLPSALVALRPLQSNSLCYHPEKSTTSSRNSSFSNREAASSSSKTVISLVDSHRSPKRSLLNKTARSESPNTLLPHTSSLLHTYIDLF